MTAVIGLIAFSAPFWGGGVSRPTRGSVPSGSLQLSESQSAANSSASVGLICVKISGTSRNKEMAYACGTNIRLAKASSIQPSAISYQTLHEGAQRSCYQG